MIPSSPIESSLKESIKWNKHTLCVKPPLFFYTRLRSNDLNVVLIQSISLKAATASIPIRLAVHQGDKSSLNSGHEIVLWLLLQLKPSSVNVVFTFSISHSAFAPHVPTPPIHPWIKKPDSNMSYCFSSYCSKPISWLLCLSSKLHSKTPRADPS